jgi:homoserine dehydrogenase
MPRVYRGDLAVYNRCMGEKGTREIGVGLLGLGNVGAGVVKLLNANAAAIEARLGARVEVKKIAVRETIKKRLVDVDTRLVTKDIAEVLDDPSVEIVCELIGGVAEARDYVLGAIARGKSVVTANKALLAVRGEEVFAAAQAAGVDIYYEAAVCGGVPIIRALREGLASDRVEEIVGIVNGTSNVILTGMADGRPYAEVLAEAQAAGYAEADPTLDVSGGDAAHKLVVLARLCFGVHAALDEVGVDGIERLEPIDFELARRFGYVIKPLAYGKDHGDGIELRVHPTMIPSGWLLAAVDGAKNALYVTSDALGPSMYYGAGAGMMPTAMAVVSDIIEVARNIRAHVTGAPLPSPPLAGLAGAVARASAGPAAPGRRRRPSQTLTPFTPRPIRPMAEVRSRYYLRLPVRDRAGVLGRLTSILGDHAISIAQVLHERARDEGAPVMVVVLTHTAREGDVRAALAVIEELPDIVAPAVVVRVGGAA